MGLEIQKCVEVTPITQSFLDFSSADESVLDCLHLSLDEFKHTGDITLLWDKFNSVVKYCIDKFVPTHRKKTKRHNPWITREIIHFKRRIKHKHKYKLAQNTELLIKGRFAHETMKLVTGVT